MDKPVLVLDTGGTIGSLVDVGGRLRPGRGSDIAAVVTDLSAQLEIAIELCSLSDVDGELTAPIDSCEMHPLYWSGLARIIRDRSASTSGIVLLHGTDTLAYTASALTFALARLSIPLVITGAQRSILEPQSDARANIALALKAAAGRIAPLAGEVVAAFGGRLLRGSRSTKISADASNGFASPALAAIDPGATHGIADALAAWCSSRSQIVGPESASFDSAVWITDIWPGIERSTIFRAIDAVEPAGVVLRLYGVGVAPSAAELVAVAEELAERDVPVLAISSIAGARLDWNRYENSRTFRDSKIINGADLTTEAALTKMMWTLAATSHTYERRALLARNIAGEMSDVKP